MKKTFVFFTILSIIFFTLSIINILNGIEQFNTYDQSNTNLLIYASWISLGTQIRSGVLIILGFISLIYSHYLRNEIKKNER